MENLADSFLKEFGKKVKSEREAKKYTLEDMAFHTGIDTSDFNKIEQGKKNITLKTFIKIAKGLNLQPKDLFDFKIKFED